MFPSNASHDDGYRCLPHAVVFGNGCLCFTFIPSSPDFPYVVFAQLGSVVSLAFHWVLRSAYSALSRPGVITLFLHHVVDVVLLVAEEKVIWPDAIRCVATMEHEQSVRYRAVRHKPRDSMRRVQNFVDPYLSVAPPVGRVFPQPARRRLFDFRPKFIPLFFRHHVHKYSTCVNVVQVST
jgi:hypothetical protein